MRLSPAAQLGVAAACVMAGVIGVIALTGRWPVDAPRTHIERDGILSIPVERVARVEVSDAREHTVLQRSGDGNWLLGGARVGAAPAGHIAVALRLLAVSPPRRVLASGEYDTARLAEYGLDPPDFVLELTENGGSSVQIGFGEATPAQNAQYVRIVGRPELYLLPRDVGGEWQLARDMALRPPGLLLPVSVAQIWGVEVIRGGVLQRFERDPAGLWFHHVGQHVHLPGGFVHKADPQLAPLLAAEFDVLDQLPIAATVAHHPDAAALDAAGLTHPSTIILFYGRDSAGPVARVGLGNAVAGGSGRYAHVPQSDTLMTVPADIEKPLGALLQIAATS